MPKVNEFVSNLVLIGPFLRVLNAAADELECFATSAKMVSFDSELKA